MNKEWRGLIDLDLDDIEAGEAGSRRDRGVLFEQKAATV